MHDTDMGQNFIQNDSNSKNSPERQNSRSRGSIPLEGCRPPLRGVDTPRADVALGFKGSGSHI